METFVTLNPAPGVWRNGTPAEAQGRWFSANLVRWKEGRLRPVGGWQSFYGGAVGVPFRGGVAWRGDDQRRWLAMGTPNGLYVHDQGTLTDITPAGFIPGRTSSLLGLGYGVMAYGAEAYGTQRTEGTSIVIDASVWTLDTFGETVVGVSTGDGKLYRWAPVQFDVGVAAPDRLAQVVATAPTNSSAVFVSKERHVVLLGAGGDPRKVAWCDRENYDEWTPGPLTTAGEISIASPGKLLRGIRFKDESILFTDADVHRMSFVGSPLVYGFEQISRGTDGLVGPNAVVEIADRLVWMGASGFWAYDGTVNRIPCDVLDYVFTDINLDQAVKFCGGHNTEFGEVWWFYASAGATENDRYVIWSYKDNWWSYGEMARTCWVPREVWPYAVASGPTGVLYQHEQGYTDSGVSRVGQVFAESGQIQIGEGQRYMDVGLLMPDKDSNSPGSEQRVSVSFNLRQNPLSDPYRVAGPYTFDNPTGYAQARFSGRLVEMRVEATEDDLFTFGRLRAAVRAGGAR